MYYYKFNVEGEFCIEFKTEPSKELIEKIESDFDTFFFKDFVLDGDDYTPPTLELEVDDGELDGLEFKYGFQGIVFSSTPDEDSYGVDEYDNGKLEKQLRKILSNNGVDDDMIDYFDVHFWIDDEPYDWEEVW